MFYFFSHDILSRVLIGSLLIAKFGFFNYKDLFELCTCIQHIIFFLYYTYLLLINNDLKDCFLLFGEKSCRGWSVPFHKYFKKISSKISYIQTDFFFVEMIMIFFFILIFKDFPSEIFCFDFRELKMWRLYKMPVTAETNQISNKN